MEKTKIVLPVAIVTPDYCNVSAIIPFYNSSSTLRRALDSIVNQTSRPKQVIIIDDGSKTSEQSRLKNIIANYSKILEIELLTFNMNAGPSIARNRGWEIATQPYIAFLDSDDSWHENKLKIQYEWMEANGEISITGHKCQVITQEIYSAPIITYSTNMFTLISKNTALFSNPWSTPTVMVKRDIPFRFNPNMKRAEDYLLWLEILLSNYKGAISKEKLAYLYKGKYGDGGLSLNTNAMGRCELKMYQLIYERKYISYPKFILLFSVSLLKLARRRIILKLQ